MIFVQYGKNSVKVLQKGLKKPPGRSIITGPKGKSFYRRRLIFMSSDHTDHPKQRSSCDAGKANESAAS